MTVPGDRKQVACAEALNGLGVTGVRPENPVGTGRAGIIQIKGPPQRPIVFVIIDNLEFFAERYAEVSIAPDFKGSTVLYRLVERHSLGGIRWGGVHGSFGLR